MSRQSHAQRGDSRVTLTRAGDGVTSPMSEQCGAGLTDLDPGSGPGRGRGAVTSQEVRGEHEDGTAARMNFELHLQHELRFILPFYGISII